MNKTKVAVIGSGNIGTDLMIKVLRLSDKLEMGAMVGIDPAPDGRARAKRFDVPVTAEGVQGRHAERAAAEYKLDTRDILVEVGRRGLVGGQEDMIIDVAIELASGSQCE
jgi:acetaldehyde dehydrogenase (acetylating)